jgi:cytolysin (calcineurin-like family phosphatase)
MLVVYSKKANDEQKVMEMNKKWLRRLLVSNYVRNFHRVSKWFKPPGGSPEFVQG